MESSPEEEDANLHPLEISSLPDDILFLVLNFLDLNDFSNILKVSKLWRTFGERALIQYLLRFRLQLSALKKSTNEEIIKAVDLNLNQNLPSFIYFCRYPIVEIRRSISRLFLMIADSPFMHIIQNFRCRSILIRSIKDKDSCAILSYCHLCIKETDKEEKISAHEQLIAQHGMQFLISHLKIKDNILRRHLLAIVGNMLNIEKKNFEKIHFFLLQLGTFKEIIAILRESINSPILKHALAPLILFMVKSQSKHLLIREGIISVLIPILLSEDHSAQDLAIHGLLTILDQDTSKENLIFLQEIFFKKGAIFPLYQLSCNISQKDRVRQWSQTVLSSLQLPEPLSGTIFEELEKLFEILFSENSSSELLHSTAASLYSFARYGNLEKLSVKKLLRLFRLSKNFKVRYYTALSIRHIFRRDSNFFSDEFIQIQLISVLTNILKEFRETRNFDCDFQKKICKLFGQFGQYSSSLNEVIPELYKFLVYLNDVTDPNIPVVRQIMEVLTLFGESENARDEISAYPGLIDICLSWLCKTWKPLNQESSDEFTHIRIRKRGNSNSSNTFNNNNNNTNQIKKNNEIKENIIDIKIKNNEIKENIIDIKIKNNEIKNNKIKKDEIKENIIDVKIKNNEIKENIIDAKIKNNEIKNKKIKKDEIHQKNNDQIISKNYGNNNNLKNKILFNNIKSPSQIPKTTSPLLLNYPRKRELNLHFDKNNFSTKPSSELTIETLSLLRTITSCLWKFSIHPDISEILAKRGLSLLPAFLDVVDEPIQFNVTATLWNLAINSDNRHMIHLIPKLVSLLPKSFISDRVKIHLVNALDKILEGDQNFISAKIVIPALVNLIHQSSTPKIPLTDVVCQVLTKFTSDSDTLDILIHYGCIDGVLKIVSNDLTKSFWSFALCLNLLNGTLHSPKIFQNYNTLQSLSFLLKSCPNDQVMCGASELLSTIIYIDPISRKELYESPEKSLFMNWNLHGNNLQKICAFHISSVLCRFYKEEKNKNLKNLKKNVLQCFEILSTEGASNPFLFLSVNRTLCDMIWNDFGCAREFIKNGGVDKLFLLSKKFKFSFQRIQILQSLAQLIKRNEGYYFENTILLEIKEILKKKINQDEKDEKGVYYSILSYSKTPSNFIFFQDDKVFFQETFEFLKKCKKLTCRIEGARFLATFIKKTKTNFYNFFEDKKNKELFDQILEDSLNAIKTRDLQTKKLIFEFLVILSFSNEYLEKISKKTKEIVQNLSQLLTSSSAISYDYVSIQVLGKFSKCLKEFRKECQENQVPQILKRIYENDSELSEVSKKALDRVEFLK